MLCRFIVAFAGGLLWLHGYGRHARNTTGILKKETDLTKEHFPQLISKETYLIC